MRLILFLHHCIFELEARGALSDYAEVMLRWTALDLDAELASDAVEQDVYGKIAA